MSFPDPVQEEKERNEMKQLYKTFLLPGVAVLMAAAAVTAGLAHGQKASQQKTFAGHVVDLACYLGHGSIGEKHRDCATACAKSGIPLAILDQKTQTLYLPLAKNHHAPANADLMPFIERDIVVTGLIVEKDGMKAILLEKIEAAK
jgi:hypothetical protein